MNAIFYEKYLAYMIQEKKYLNNTIGTKIKVLKTFLNFCINNELTGVKINLKPFKVFKEEIDIIYLTNDELFRIYNLKNLPRTLECVKDNFCFGCFTGLRFSDIQKLNNSHIKENFIEIRTEKTKDLLKIPINKYVTELFEKYKGKFENRPLPPTLNNCETNYALKEIAKLASIDTIIEIEKFSGANKVIIKEPKYNLVQTHTARRTFVTLSLEKGIRPEVVMSITGHKKYQVFQRYIKITDTIKLKEVINFWN